MFIAKHRQRVYGCSTFCVFENVYSQVVGRCKYIVEEVAKETKEEVAHRMCSCLRVSPSLELPPGDPSVPASGWRSLAALFLTLHPPLSPLF